MRISSNKNLEKDGMILYHAVSIYQLLECIVYKTIHHNNERTILLIRDLTQARLGDKCDLLEKYLLDCACLFSKRNTDITSNIAKTQH